MASARSQPGMLLVISGPSGVGKTTITHKVEREIGAYFSVSMTTRPRSRSDRDGVDYHFVTRERFEQALRDGELLEWAEYSGNYYGTPRLPVEQHLRNGDIVLLEIDVKGALQVKQAMPDAYAIFVEPPNMDVLLQRLRDRQREAEDVIQRRFARAKDEIAQAHSCGIYDKFIVNDDLDTAVNEAVTGVREQLARRRACAV